MVSGTDEHGTPIMVAADRKASRRRSSSTGNNAVIREDLRRLGLSYDLFTRTTTANHHRVVRDVFRTLYDRGYLVERTTLGAFSAATGQTLPDRYIEGTCPICGFAEARGDQCDNCGNQLDPQDLIEPRSKVDGEPPSSGRRRISSSTCPCSATGSGRGSRTSGTGGRTSVGSRCSCWTGYALGR
jgi:methionyl-tRNA synthetase